MPPLIARYVLPGVGALLALWAAYSWAYGRGVADERASWQEARAELLALRTERANHAADDLAQKSTLPPAAATKETVRVETHWRDRSVRGCFDADLVQSLEEARRAVRQSATASPSSD